MWFSGENLHFPIVGLCMSYTEIQTSQFTKFRTISKYDEVHTVPDCTRHEERKGDSITTNFRIPIMKNRRIY